MTPTKVRGIDISHNNGSVNWSAMKAAGIEFTFIKATEGHTFVDPRYRVNKQGAQAAGILTAAYHYFRPTWDAALQAHHFVNVVGSEGFHGMLPPALDVELDPPERVGIYAHDYVHSIKAWLDTLETLIGVKAVLYSYPDMWNWLDNPVLFSDHPLWDASYQPTPRLLSGWNRVTYHQYSDTGVVASHRGIDLDWYEGSIEDLKQTVIA